MNAAAGFGRDAETIKSECSISSIIGQHIELKRCGAELRGCCPFHSDRTPSLYVNERKGQFHCFGCGAGGDVIEFIRKLYNMSFHEALNHLASEPAVIPFSTKWDPVHRTDRKAQVQKIWNEALPIDGTPAERYLDCRSISADLSRLQPNLRFAQLPFDGSTKLHPTLVVAARNLAGEVVAIQRIYLRDDGTKLSENCKRSLGSVRGAAVQLYGFDGPIDDVAHIYLTEGVEDALSVARIMGKATVWATLGTSNMMNVELPPECNSVIIAHDNDDAGLSAALETAVHLMRSNVAVSLQAPSEFKDWNEHLVYWDQQSALQHYNELPWNMDPELLCDEFDCDGEGQSDG